MLFSFIIQPDFWTADAFTVDTARKFAKFWRAGGVLIFPNDRQYGNQMKAELDSIKDLNLKKIIQALLVFDKTKGGLIRYVDVSIIELMEVFNEDKKDDGNKLFDILIREKSALTRSTDINGLIDEKNGIERTSIIGLPWCQAFIDAFMSQKGIVTHGSDTRIVFDQLFSDLLDVGNKITIIDRYALFDHRRAKKSGNRSGIENFLRYMSDSVNTGRFDLDIFSGFRENIPDGKQSTNAKLTQSEAVQIATSLVTVCSNVRSAQLHISEERNFSKRFHDRFIWAGPRKICLGNGLSIFGGNTVFGNHSFFCDLITIEEQTSLYDLNRSCHLHVLK